MIIKLETMKLSEFGSMLRRKISKMGFQIIQDENNELGSIKREQIENIEFGRIAAQAAKQVIVQKVREAKEQR